MAGLEIANSIDKALFDKEWQQIFTSPTDIEKVSKMSNTINPDTLLMQMRAMAAQAQGKSAETSSVSGQSEFSDILKQSVDKVNDSQMNAKKLADAFQTGDPGVQVSEVMVALQKSNVSFQAMLQVRNKLVNAYQEIMNMQV